MYKNPNLVLRMRPFVFRRIIVVSVITVALIILFANKVDRRKRQILDTKISKTLDKITELEKNLGVSGFTSEVESKKQQWDKTVNSIANKRHSWKKKNETKIQSRLESDMIKKKVHQLALDRSKLSPEKIAEIQKIRDKFDENKRKATLKAKISKIQDVWARKNFELVTDPAYLF